jgi:hypothetical protein
MKRRKLRTPEEPNRAYQALMHDICVGMGFCGSVDNEGNPRHVDHYIPKSGIVTARQFAEWVMLADGMEPFDGSGHQAEIEKLFVEHMGSNVAEATELDWFRPTVNPE